jgi:hypothetical protein
MDFVHRMEFQIIVKHNVSETETLSIFRRGWVDRFE